jgi:D-cysteine desulfhydrase
VTSYPLFAVWPRLANRVPRAALGDFPSPLERAAALEAELGRGPFYLKRDDLTSSIYGGNKVRPLETLFGAALAAGKREIVSVGAFGSNHALAAALHAPRVGLRPAAIVFPQPLTATAYDNFLRTVTRSSRLVVVPHWSLIPPAIWLDRRPERAIMAPGGATPLGALGYVAAGLELGMQIAAAGIDAPRRIYVGIGSTCTTAGLLVGLSHAARLGIGFREVPTLVAVRVTPWPITSRFRVLRLSLRTAELLAELAEDASLRLSRDALSERLELDGGQLGAGYGLPTPGGQQAIDWFREHARFDLDTTYSGKSAAAFLRAARERRDGPLLFWSTKSTAPLPDDVLPAQGISARARRWLEHGSTVHRANSPRVLTIGGGSEPLRCRRA